MSVEYTFFYLVKFSYVIPTKWYGISMLMRLTKIPPEWPYVC